MMAFWRLQEIAKPERWNAKTLAEASGLAYTTVWGMWANKTRRADLDTMQKIADVLGIHPRDLIGTGPRKPAAAPPPQEGG